MKIAIAAKINGQPQDLIVAPDQTLLDLLRDDLSLRGTVEGCGDGFAALAQCLSMDGP